MSQKHPKTIIKIKSNPWKIRVKKFFFSKFADWRGKISEERFSWNSLGACFRKYAISLKVVARLKNLEVKIPYVKKYMTQNPEKPQLIDSMILNFFFQIVLLTIPFLQLLHYIYKRKTPQAVYVLHPKTMIGATKVFLQKNFVNLSNELARDN